MIHTTITSRFKSMFLALAILPAMVYAQSAVPAEKLTEVSDEMYKLGNANYILVDAIKDGVIEFKERYNFTYENGHIKFNGKELPSGLRKSYEDKMSRLLVTTGKGLDTRMYYRGDGIKEKDILNENSSFRKQVDVWKEHEKIAKEHEEIRKQHEEIRKQHEEIAKEHEIIAKQHAEIAKHHEEIAKNMEEVTRKNVEAGKKQTAYTDKIIAAMTKDGLVSKNEPMHIQWNLKGIFVNDKKLTGDLFKKYNEMFEQEAGFKLKQPDDGVEITKNDTKSTTKASN